MRYCAAVALTLAGLLAASGCSRPDTDQEGGAEANAAPLAGGGISAAYLHGDWCQRFTPPRDTERPDEEPVEERLHLRFEPTGRFSLGRSVERLTSLGDWSLDGGVLQMPGNPVAGRPTPRRVSADEFHFQFMGVEIRVKRGHCPPE
ncbi:MAG: hypothetical protein ABR551_01280 [Gemmatimonadales bacterium]